LTEAYSPAWFRVDELSVHGLERDAGSVHDATAGRQAHSECHDQENAKPRGLLETDDPDGAARFDDVVRRMEDPTRSSRAPSARELLSATHPSTGADLGAKNDPFAPAQRRKLPLRSAYQPRGLGRVLAKRRMEVVRQSRTARVRG
jgi:hypothetical protein